jgi:tRNA-specific 2-thiouridylase
MEKVVVGMSGGVDSSVAAYLLQKQGYDVIGVTMQIWQDEDICTLEENGGCCGLSAVEDARRVASVLDIPYYVMNFKQEFKDNVIDYFVGEYLEARTPNPCIACNRYVKWESLLKRSLDIGASYIATGHYASIERLPNGRYTIKKSVTQAKDQTYALYNLTQHQLSHTLMPVGSYAKDEIRRIAVEQKLPVAHKPDSQEICFVPDNDYAGFIAKYLEDKKGNVTEQTSDAFLGMTPGNYVNTAGEILGRHRGMIHYTVGQRKGLGIAMGQPVFVVELRPETNEVVLGNADEVFSDRLYANRLNFMSIEDLEGELEVEAKIRYSHKGARCIIKKTDTDEVLCVFEEPQRAITPGQAVVFYQGDYVVGGGTIIK